MKFQFRIRVDQPEGKQTTSYYYADVTVEGDVKAVQNFLEFVWNKWDLDHIK